MVPRDALHASRVLAVLVDEHKPDAIPRRNAKILAPGQKHANPILAVQAQVLNAPGQTMDRRLPRRLVNLRESEDVLEDSFQRFQIQQHQQKRIHHPHV